MSELPTGDEARRLPFFVYGTLKPGESNYAAYLEEGCTATQTAHIHDAALFSDGTYPYLVLDSRAVPPNDIAYGMVVEVKPESYNAVLERLDWLEDYKPNSPWSMYARVIAVAHTDTGPVDVWAYVGGPQSLAAIRAGRLVYIPGGVWSGRNE